MLNRDWLLAMSPGLLLIAASFIPIIGALHGTRQAAKKAAERQAQEAEAARKKAEAATRKANDQKAREAAAARHKAEAQERKRKLTAADLMQSVPEGSKPFAGEKIAFTGTFPRVIRKELVEVVSRLGGTGHMAVHAGSTLLVVCPGPGSGQVEKAEHYKIPSITWEMWYKRAFGRDPGPEFQTV